MQTSYEVNVIGRTWAGYEGTHTYNFYDGIPTADEVKRKAGDFQAITDYQVVRHEQASKRQGPTLTTMHTVTVVRNWDSERSADVWESCNV